MANKYWYQTGANANWDALANWWTHPTHLVQADAIPVAGDAVYLLGATAPDSDPALDVALSVFDTSQLAAESYSAPANVSIGEGGTLIMGDLAEPGNFHAWTGDASLAASATFYDSSYIDAGTVGDNAVFNDSSANVGTVGDNATFNVGATNLGIVGDGATFNDSAYNASGEIGDTATFDTDAAQGGTFTGTTYYVRGSSVDFSLAAFTAVGTISFVLTLADSQFTGLITTNGVATAAAHTVSIASQAGLVAGNIVDGVTILGVPGEHPTVAQTQAADAADVEAVKGSILESVTDLLGVAGTLNLDDVVAPVGTDPRGGGVVLAGV